MRTSTRAARDALSGVATEKATVYDELRYDRHQIRLRLKQERIG